MRTFLSEPAILQVCSSLAYINNLVVNVCEVSLDIRVICWAYFSCLSGVQHRNLPTPNHALILLVRVLVLNCYHLSVHFMFTGGKVNGCIHLANLVIFMLRYVLVDYRILFTCPCEQLQSMNVWKSRSMFMNVSRERNRWVVSEPDYLGGQVLQDISTLV